MNPNPLPIALETKDLIGLVLLTLGSLGATALLLTWPRLRAVALFITVMGLAASTYFDLNVYSAYWYRGTTRGFEFTVFDVLAVGLLVSSLLAPRANHVRWFWPASLGFMLLYIAYCTANSLLATPSVFGLYEVSKLLRGVLYFLAAAAYIREERDLGVLVLALAGAVIIESALAVRGRYFFDEYRPGGTLEHPNSLSMYLCMAAPVLISAACASFPGWIRAICWVAAGAAAVGDLLTLSRAGLPVFVFVAGGALAWGMSWKPTPGRFVLGLVAIAALGALVLRTWPLILERYEQSTLQEEYFDAPGESRGYYFRQAGVMLDSQPLGVGLNNWSYWVSKEYGKALGMRYENYDDIVYAPPTDVIPSFRFAAPAHNLGVLTMGELGWPGLALLLVLWLRWLGVGAGFLFSRSADPLRRLGVGLAFGMLGVFLHSFTEWTFRQTQIYLTFCVLAGTLAALHAARRAEARARAEAMDAAPEDAWAEVALPAGAPFHAGGN